VPSDWALGMAQAVAGGARFPPLILVTTGPGGVLVVLEGHARLTSFMLSRDRLPPGTGGPSRVLTVDDPLGAFGDRSVVGERAIGRPCNGFASAAVRIGWPMGLSLRHRVREVSGVG
jgi:hypothetical protein